MNKLIPQYTNRKYNFKEIEFCCKDNVFGYKGEQFCNRSLPKDGINPLLLEGLQFLREYFSKEMIISSPYRCLIYNRKIGSGDYSQHILGTAADIVIKDTCCKDVMRVIEAHNLFTGRGLYPDNGDNFCHVDVRDGLLALQHTRIARWVKVNGIYSDVNSFDQFI